MPTFNEIQQEIAGMLSIPDEELTPEQREAMDAYSVFTENSKRPLPTSLTRTPLPRSLARSSLK